MPDPFQIDPRIAAATLPLHESELCATRLMDDSRYPWLVLVPCRPGATELFDLAADDLHRVIDWAAHLATCMRDAFDADKINIGALGNRVPQLHLHVIARRSGDAAWPDAVWNGTAAVPYEQAEREAILLRLRLCLTT